MAETKQAEEKRDMHPARTKKHTGVGGTYDYWQADVELFDRRKARATDHSEKGAVDKAYDKAKAQDVPAKRK